MSSDSKITIIDKNNVEARVVKQLFNTLSFEYSGMSGKPTGYKYDKCKDSIKWLGLKPKDYIPLLDAMFREFVKYLPKSS